MAAQTMWSVPLRTDYHKRRAVVVLAAGPVEAIAAARAHLERQECYFPGAGADCSCLRCENLAALGQHQPQPVDGAYQDEGCNC